MKIDWKKALGYGAIIYAVVYLVVCAFIGMKIDPNTTIWAWAVIEVAFLATAVFLATKLGTKNINEALVYGLVWAVIMVVGDLVLTVPFTGIEFMYQWTIWLSYALTFLIPAATLTFVKK